ncbi:MAG: hypothetical protein QM765_34245 [Myxococcales bacterium]
MADFADLDHAHLASTSACSWPAELDEALRADLSRGDPTGVFCEAALAWLRESGDLAPVSEALAKARQLRSEAGRIEEPASRRERPSESLFTSTGAGVWPGVTCRSGGLSDYDRAFTIRLLLRLVDAGAVAPLLAVRFGHLHTAFAPLDDRGLEWLWRLLMESAPYTSRPRAVWQECALPAPSLGGLLDKLGYSPDSLIQGALFSDLHDWRTPADVAATAEAGLFADRHAETVLRALREKAPKRLAHVLEFLRLVRPTSPPILEAIDQLAGDRRKTVASPAKAIAALLRAEESDAPYEVAGFKTSTPLASFAPNRTWRSI